MSSTPTKVLILGATGRYTLLFPQCEVDVCTGYIGGCILLRVLQIKGLEVTVLVRSADKAKKLRDLNLEINIVEGTSAADADLLRDLTKDADYIIDAVRMI